jgi:hypothetical protein
MKFINPAVADLSHTVVGFRLLIVEKQRRAKQEFWREFEVARPRISDGEEMRCLGKIPLTTSQAVPSLFLRANDVRSCDEGDSFSQLRWQTAGSALSGNAGFQRPAPWGTGRDIVFHSSTRSDIHPNFPPSPTLPRPHKLDFAGRTRSGTPKQCARVERKPRDSCPWPRRVCTSGDGRRTRPTSDVAAFDLCVFLMIGVLALAP